MFLAPEPKEAAQDLDPLFHGQEAQGFLLREDSVPFKAQAIVLDGKGDPLFVSFNFQKYVFRFGVFADIRQSFLHYPVDRRLDWQREQAIEIVHFNGPFYLLLQVSKIIDQGTQRGGQTQVLQVAWT
jgi:hypothetical protein